MKILILIFICIQLNVIGNYAQTPVCTVNTMGWKKVSTIPVDFDCIKTFIQTQTECKRSYNTSSDFVVLFYKCLQHIKTNSQQKHIFDNYDLTKYNLIVVVYGKGDACDMSMNYNLYNDGTQRPALLVNVLIPEVRCKAIKSILQCFLVLKKDCPIRPKVCLLQHLIELSKDND